MNKALFFVSMALLTAVADAQSLIPISISEDPLDSLTEIIYGITVGVAIVMLMLNGLKWIVSDSDQGRFEAKQAMIYIAVALVLILIAELLVSLFFGAAAPTGYN